MFKIEIEIPRPRLLFSLIVVFALGWYASIYLAYAHSADIGGSGTDTVQVEGKLKDLRAMQRVLGKREEILRANLQAIEDASAQFPDDPVRAAALDRVREELLMLLNNARQAETDIRQSLEDLWDAEGYLFAASTEATTTDVPTFDWPVEPMKGISAHFDDAGYEARFGMPHHAIDIPTPQGSIVRAVADGIILRVSEKGMGFNSIVLQHDGGIASLYGHVSAFLVGEGQRVRIGDPIARSGGMPGTPGAGRLTTGPHLHLQFMQDGTPVDPLGYMPER